MLRTRQRQSVLSGYIQENWTLFTIIALYWNVVVFNFFLRNFFKVLFDLSFFEINRFLKNLLFRLSEYHILLKILSHLFDTLKEKRFLLAFWALDGK